MIERRYNWKTSRLIQITLLFLVCFAVYFNTLSNGFVYDDLHQVVNNYQIRDIRYIPEIFSTSLWEFVGRGSSYYRPVLNLIFMLNYHIFGLAPWGFHLVNILFHAGVSVLVFFITSKLLGKFTLRPKRGTLPTQNSAFTSPLFHPPLIAGLLFATHPIHTEAVTWVSGVMDLSFTLFSLLSFYFYILSEEQKNGVQLLSAISFFMAALCKEPALMLPAIFVAYDYAIAKRGRSIMQHVKRYSPYLVAAGVYFAMRLNALGGVAPVKSVITLDFSQYVVNIFALFSKYLEKLFFPVQLNLLHIFHPVTSVFSIRAVIAAIIVILFLAVTVITLKRNRIIFLSLTFMLIPLLPVLYLPGLTQGLENSFTERYLYLPSFGFVLLVASICSWIEENRPRWTMAISLIVLVTILLYSVATINRNSVWKSDLTLSSDAVEKSPESAIAHQNLGFALLHAGRTEEGKEQLRSALRLKPELTEDIIGNGIAYARKGLIDKAILEFHTALIVKPGSFEAHYNLGLAYGVKGWTDQAIEQYSIALELRPDNAPVHNNLGIAYAKKGLIDKAIEHFEAAVRLNGGDPDFRANLEKARKLKRGSAGPHDAK